MLRALIFAVSLPLASSGALPVWARLVGVEGPHVCHCSIDKHDCVCAKCNPELEEELLLTSESLLGRCGDDAPVAERVSLPPATILLVSDLARPPPTPPPRLSSSAV